MKKFRLKKFLDEAFGNLAKRNKDMAERVLIVTNDGKDADYAITNQVKEYLTQAGKDMSAVSKR